MANKQVNDSCGNPFIFARLDLDKSEYAKIISEINTNYTVHDGMRISAHFSIDLEGKYCIYYFENHGFDDYNIYNKKYL